ncbi:MAG: adenylate/guanylate cyclase domain-containing protein [Aeromicrobium sp.]
MPETQYARCGDLSLAYQVFGSGPLNVVVCGSFVTNVEVMWGSPEYKSFFDHMGSYARVLIFDKGGVGLSDPIGKVRTMEERTEEIESVMDAAGFEQAALIGYSEGGAASILLAATRPERVRALVLIGSTVISPIPCSVDWEDAVDLEPSVLVQRVGEMIGAEYLPEEHQIIRLQGVGRLVRDAWGTGEAMALFMPSIRSRQQLGMIERVSASPGMARATVTAFSSLDVRSVLPTLRLPTLVVHATDDIVPVQFGRYLADHIPGARMLEFPGHDHVPWLSATGVTHAIEEFLTGAKPRAQTQRALRTILFTDIVGSTERATAMGDERWHALLDRYDEVTRATVESTGGRVLKSTGDGHLATIDGPAQGIRCAEAVRSAVEPLGIELRFGVHTGECELMGTTSAASCTSPHASWRRPHRARSWSRARCGTSSPEAASGSTTAASTASRVFLVNGSCWPSTPPARARHLGKHALRRTRHLPSAKGCDPPTGLWRSSPGVRPA